MAISVGFSLLNISIESGHSPGKDNPLQKAIQSANSNVGVDTINFEDMDIFDLMGSRETFFITDDLVFLNSDKEPLSIPSSFLSFDISKNTSVSIIGIAFDHIAKDHIATINNKGSLTFEFCQFIEIDVDQLAKVIVNEGVISIKDCAFVKDGASTYIAEHALKDLQNLEPQSKSPKVSSEPLDLSNFKKASISGHNL